MSMMQKDLVENIKTLLHKYKNFILSIYLIGICDLRRSSFKYLHIYSRNQAYCKVTLTKSYSAEFVEHPQLYFWLSWLSYVTKFHNKSF